MRLDVCSRGPNAIIGGGVASAGRDHRSGVNETNRLPRLPQSLGRAARRIIPFITLRRRPASR
jgi:hypothetical protein